MSWFFREAHHSQLYKKFRPSYPSDLYEKIFLFLRQKTLTSKWNKCLDIGCGTGISTLPLASSFQEVIGVDYSSSQLDEAVNYCQPYQNIKFKKADAYNLEFATNKSIDLITTAQSLHWLKIPEVSNEFKRILKPDGVFAAYGYGMFVLDNKEANNIIHKEVYKDLLSNYWEEGRRHIDDLYSEIFLQLKQQFKYTYRDDSLSIFCEYSIDDYIGYVSTWSGYQKYLKIHNDEPQPLIKVSKRLKDIYGDKRIKAMAPIFILIAN